MNNGRRAVTAAIAVFLGIGVAWQILILLGLAAPPDPPRDPNEPVVPPTPAEFAQLRDETLAQVPPIFDRPELRITDPEIVDPALRKAIENNAGRMPNAAERPRVVGEASMRIRTTLAEPEMLKRISALIRKHYDEPAITRVGGVVRVDMGVLPGDVGYFRGSAGISNSPHVDHFEWKTSEVVRALRLGIAKHPDARVFQAEIEIPGHRRKPEWTYVYDLDEDKIRVYTAERPDGWYATGKLDGKLGDLQSLNHFDLKWVDYPGVKPPERSLKRP